VWSLTARPRWRLQDASAPPWRHALHRLRRAALSLFVRAYPYLHAGLEVRPEREDALLPAQHPGWGQLPCPGGQLPQGHRHACYAWAGSSETTPPPTAPSCLPPAPRPLQGARLAYQLLFLLGVTPYHSPFMHLIGQRLVRVTGQELVSAQRGSARCE
jgi:hypothetical protein